MDAWRRRFETQGSPQLEPGPPPVPVRAQLTRAGTIFRCEFDRDLQVVPLSLPNWRLYANHWRMYLSMAFVDGVNVIGAAKTLAPALKPDTCNYFGNPLDVRSLTGVPAAPFSDFPLEVFG